MGPEERDRPRRRRIQQTPDPADADVAGGGGRGGVQQTATAVSPAARRWLWHERTAWLLLLYAAAFGYGLSLTGLSGSGPLNGVFGMAAACAAIMACVTDSILVGRPVPYSWRNAMFVLAPLLPLTSAMVAWRTRRWWGLLAVAVNLLVLGWTLLAGFLVGVVVSAV